MARSSSGFMFPINFMTKEDKLKIATKIASISPDWCRVEWMYNPESENSWEKDYLSMEESGIWLTDIEDMMEHYIAFVLKHYPNVECKGDAHYDQLNAEGHFAWNFTIKDRIANIQHISEPLDHPVWCPECDEELDYYIDNLTVDNYMDYTYTCPKCGYVIKPYEDYDIMLEEYSYNADEFEDEE